VHINELIIIDYYVM